MKKDNSVWTITIHINSEGFKDYIYMNSDRKVLDFVIRTILNNLPDNAKVLSIIDTTLKNKNTIISKIVIDFKTLDNLSLFQYNFQKISKGFSKDINGVLEKTAKSELKWISDINKSNGFNINIPN